MLLIGTRNKSRVQYIKALIADTDIKVCSLNDIENQTLIEECGQDTFENACLKAKGYHMESGLPTLSIDAGLYFDGFSDKEQPGIYVRRINGMEKSDEEMIEYYKEVFHRKGGLVQGNWVTSFVLALKVDQIFTIDIRVLATFCDKPSGHIIEGLPLHSLQIDPESGVYKSETYSPGEKDDGYDDKIRTFLLSHLTEMEG